MGNTSHCICMFSNLYPPVVSGSSSHVSSLARELAKRGYQIVVITAKVSKETKEYEQIDNVHVYRLPAILLPKFSISLKFPWLNYTLTPRNLRRIGEIFLRHQPEIIHLHNHMFDLAFFAVIMRKRFRVPLVISIHTVMRHTTQLYNLLLYPFDRILLRYGVIKQSDLIICPDKNIEHYVHETFPHSPMALLPYGIELPSEPDENKVSQLRRRYNLKGKRIILSLGHVNEFRDRRDLIAALPKIQQAVPNVMVIIVGAEATETPRRLARQLGVEEAVIFTGHVPHSEIPIYLKLADIEMHLFYQSNQKQTSLGIASLEAMGAGKVVLVAANENTYGKNVLKNGENIILVKPKNPEKLSEIIIGLLNDHERCYTIGERARQTVLEHFSWDSVCAKTFDVYKEVLRKHKAQ